MHIFIGLIHWKIVIHGFVDGYSRFVLRLQASNNNRAETVGRLFASIVQERGYPSRVRGDHGVENLVVARMMEDFRGLGRGSYIWGKSVHNVRIERMWVDVVKGFVREWSNFFHSLELHHGLNRHNDAHIALLHHLFLGRINEDALAWMNGWNAHPFSRLPNHPRRSHLPSPREMYILGMVEHGVRASQPAHEDVPEADLRHYGVDWTEHRNDEVMRTHWQNNRLGSVQNGDEHANGWSMPSRFVEIHVPAPRTVLSLEQEAGLHDSLLRSGIDLQSHSMEVRKLQWEHALNYCSSLV